MITTNPAGEWQITLKIRCPGAQDPQALIERIGSLAPITLASAHYPWHDPCSITAWSAQQGDAVLADTLATVRLAQETNAAARFTLHQALANLLDNPDISVDALGVLVNSVQECADKALRLHTLSQTLQGLCQARGMAVAADQPPAPVTCSHIVISRDTGHVFANEDAFPNQLAAAMSSIAEVPELVEEDGHASPYDELMTLFSREWQIS